MHIVEEYEELIERDPTEIPFLWKTLQLVLYFAGAITGYACSIIFYLLWHDVFGGICPLWAKLEFLPIDDGRDEQSEIQSRIDTGSLRSDDIRQYIIVDYESESFCKIYFIACFLSCIFGIIWMVLFFMCAKGGYATGINASPWRIVLPSLSFNFIFAIIIMYTTSSMTRGYQKFTVDVQDILSAVTDMHHHEREISDCESVQTFLEFHKLHKYNTCNMFAILETLSWLMTWSWIGGLALLILRVIMFMDFYILKVKIYDLPYESIPLDDDTYDEKIKVN